ncbi:conserved hypothetical protein [Chloroherpeton thalassium ATCC 35110]|uniref:DUF3124 domain-containing protein n=1 Tax=Chloroherpeton thalassium (strain ATCC 35110 / GB-78) TaxID=517418 RepID=B3QUA9_CHLT3|nr:DUF3124 domain-containing protein [Chloroherpeton thalassium]ACF14358.1 conserved hypothetical protein [Chloroherpeton thalassium ATCC 35110]
MKNIIGIILVALLFYSCKPKEEVTSIKLPNWESRKAAITKMDSLAQGKSYLPVYSHIYHRFEDRTFDLTITVSIRNTSLTDSIYILKADYFNTAGDRIRQYLQNPVYLKPMETIEIIIEENDTEGGSGANFVFDWASKSAQNLPLFEAVMISTSGQQGLSFSTRGIEVHN